MGLCQGYGFRALLGFSLYKVWTMPARCSFLAMHSPFLLFLPLHFSFCNIRIELTKFCHHVLSMWPTTYVKGGDGLSKEDQMRIGIRKRFRKQVSLVSCLFVYVLHLELFAFALSCSSSFVKYSFTSLVHPMFVRLCSLLECKENEGCLRFEVCVSQSSELHFTFYTLCLCTMYALSVSPNLFF
jgi:hypothetical protein